MAGGGGSTADNGLTLTGNNIQLGGTLLEDTIIDATEDYHLIVVGSGILAPFRVSSSNITSLFASTGGIAVQATAGESFPAGHFTNNTPYADSVIDAIHAQHGPDGVAAALGIGVGISMNVSTDSGIIQSNRLISKWTDITHATRSSQFSITGLDSGTTKELLRIDGNGVFTLVQGLQNFVNDAAAAAGGIAVNQLYRNGSVVMIRVS